MPAQAAARADQGRPDHPPPPPHGLPAIDARVAHGRFPPAAVARPPALARLDPAGRRALAVAALGPSFDVEVAGRLAAAGRDSPLVIVVGAHLLRAGRVAPGTLDHQEAFRRTVFGRLLGEAAAEFVPEALRPLAFRLMRLVAVLRPIQADDPATLDALATDIRTSASDVTLTLVELERSGVLERGGRFVRIVPDLLADDVLMTACVREGGRPTGYADQVFTAFAAAAGATVLANLSEIDWRFGDATGSRTLDKSGHTSLVKFRVQPHSGRAEWLRVLFRVTALQPGHTLRIVEDALDHPSEVPERPVFALFGGETHGSVVDAVAAVLGRVASRLEHLPRAAELLWRTTRADRGTSPRTTGGRGLDELNGGAATAVRTSLGHVESLLGLIEYWAPEPGAFGRGPAPLDVLDALLAKGGQWSRAEGRRFQYTSHRPQTTLGARATCSIVTSMFPPAAGRSARRRTTAGRGTGPYVAATPASSGLRSARTRPPSWLAGTRARRPSGRTRPSAAPAAARGAGRWTRSA